MMKPKISVVIPTCHRNDALAQCLDRLKPGVQTLVADDYEVIVSDDGSKSTAQAMIREHYPWVQWIAGPRRGPAANRNCGVGVARGAHLVFTDDDCLPSPQWLQAYANAIGQGDGVYEGMTEATGPLRRPFVIAPVSFPGGKLWSCNMMVERGLFDKMNGFDEGFPYASDEDTDFRERVKAAGYTLYFVTDALLYHPPVRRVWGRNSARLWEGKVRLGYKADPDHSGFTRRFMARSVLNTRVRQIWRSPWHFDKFWALPLLLIELLWAVRHTRSWDRKQRRSLGIGTTQPRPTASDDSSIQDAI